MAAINKRKVILYVLGFLAGCALMLAAIIGLYLYTATKETAAVSSPDADAYIVVAATISINYSILTR